MEQKLKIVMGGKEISVQQFIDLVKSKGGAVDGAGFGDRCGADLVRQGEIKENIRRFFGGVFDTECIGHDGNMKWEDIGAHNIVTDEAVEHILDILFVSATTQLDPFYVGLIDATPTPAITDTAAGIDTSAQVWGEDQNYSEAVRQTYVDVRSGKSVTNSASKASFSINGTTTIGGAFLVSSSVKGGTSGTLLAAAAFTGGDRAVVNGDTLNVTYTFTGADDGA